jgi:ankyrin repeat protein
MSNPQIRLTFQPAINVKPIVQEIPNQNNMSLDITTQQVMSSSEISSDSDTSSSSSYNSDTNSDTNYDTDYDTDSESEKQKKLKYRSDILNSIETKNWTELMNLLELTENELDHNIVDIYTNTPLMICLKLSDAPIEIIFKLIEKSNVHSINDFKENALNISIYLLKPIEIIEKIIEKTDINRIGSINETPLTLAIKLCVCSDIIDSLIKKFVAIPNIKEEYPLELAIRNNYNSETLMKLINVITANQLDKLSNTPLMLSLKSKTDINVITTLLGLTTNINHQNFNGETALIIAIKNNHYWNNLSDLIKASNVNLFDVSQTNALMFGIKYNLPNYLLDELSESTNLNHRNHFGFDIFELAKRYQIDL